MSNRNNQGMKVMQVPSGYFEMQEIYVINKTAIRYRYLGRVARLLMLRDKKYKYLWTWLKIEHKKR